MNKFSFNLTRNKDDRVLTKFVDLSPLNDGNTKTLKADLNVKKCENIVFVSTLAKYFIRLKQNLYTGYVYRISQ
jgi:hypothetical protein